jgi:hypothetical protein
MPRLLLAALTLSLAVPAAAQPHVTTTREAPAGGSDLASLGSGGAVAATPTFDSPFLANPAHIATGGFSLNVIGVTAGAGGNVSEVLDFYTDELSPAMEEGLETIREEDPDRLEALYDEALRIGSQPKTADLGVLAPSVRAAFGPAAVGIGVYGQSVTRGRIRDGGAGIPYVDLYSQADLAVPVVAGVDLAKTPLGAALPFGLRVGASATVLQRRVTAKAATVDALDPDDEKLYVFRGNTTRFAAGLFATDVAVRGVDVGAEVSNVGGGVDYAFDRSIAVAGSDDMADDLAEVAALEARFDGRETAPVVRVGVAYRLPAFQSFSGAGVAVDYTTAATSDYDQSLQAGLRAGAHVRLGRVLELRGGVSQGMPSAGAALVTRVARFEYATYGVEDGRLLGQLRRRNHVVRVRFGLF